MATSRAWKGIPVIAAVCALAIAVSTVGCGAPAQQQQAAGKQFTMEMVNKGRALFPRNSPGNIIWMPDGASFLYQIREGEDKDQATILYKYDAVKGESTRIANWDEVITRLKGTRQDNERGRMGDVNSAGRVNATPMTLSADGTMLLGAQDGDVFIFPLATGEARFLTNTPGSELWPTFSPNGAKVAYTRDRDIWVSDVASGKETRLTNRGDNKLIYNGVPDWVTDEEFGLRNAFWWSPDSRRIAYLQFDTTAIRTFPIVDHMQTVAGLELQQYPKAGDPNASVRLGVVSAAGGATGWINTGKDPDSYIVRVGWVPMGDRVWFQWVNRDQTILELNFANPENGSIKTIISENDPAWVEISDDLTFVDDTSFLWTSERSGWRQIYLYSIDGVLNRQLTDGQWEVTSVKGLDAARKFVYFVATEVSPMERHIYRVGLDGNDFKRLSNGEGTHGIDKAVAGDYYIGSFSGVNTPMRMDIFSAAGEKLFDFDSGAMPGLENLTLAQTEYFTIKADDGTELYASLVKPADFDATKKYPVLVSIYGGPGSQAVVKRFSLDPFTQYLAQQGILTFRIDNRGTGARGRDFNRVMHRRLGYWELKDHVAGIDYLKTLPYVDGTKIGITGGSYGGYMTLYAMLKAPEVFCCGVAQYSVTDWRYYDSIYTERYMDRPQDNPEGYKESSPVNFAAGLKGALLMTHGTMDNNVHWQNTLVMVERLVEAGKDFRLMVYPRERHGFRQQQHRTYNNRLVISFLMEHLLGRLPVEEPALPAEEKPAA